MSATYVGFIERGENVPTLPMLLRLADALDVALPQPLADVWFGRNLAIFNNIARNTAKGDRVLVI